MTKECVRYNYTISVEADGVIKNITQIEFQNVSLIKLSSREFRTEEFIDSTHNSDETNNTKKYKFHIRMVLETSLKIFFRTPYQSSLKVSSTCTDKCVMKTIHTDNDIKFDNVQGTKWQLLTMIPLENLYHNYKKDMILKHLCITLEFIMTEAKEVSPDHCQVELSNDFHNLFYTQLLSDVIIKSVDQIEHKSHKAVLASRSVVFKANFAHNTSECLTNVVESPFTSEVLKEVLAFMYTGKTSLLDTIALKILVAADYYQLNQLKNLCEDALYKNLTVENVVEILQIADLHSADFLKLAALEFIKNGHASLVVKTDGWANLMSPELIKTVYEYEVTLHDKEIVTMLHDKMFFN